MWRWDQVGLSSDAAPLQYHPYKGDPAPVTRVTPSRFDVRHHAPDSPGFSEATRTIILAVEAVVDLSFRKLDENWLRIFGIGRGQPGGQPLAPNHGVMP